MAPLTTAGSTVSLDCHSDRSDTTAIADTKLIAIKIDSWTRIKGAPNGGTAALRP
jgi:hypothetical protein